MGTGRDVDRRPRRPPNRSRGSPRRPSTPPRHTLNGRQTQTPGDAYAWPKPRGSRHDQFFSDIKEFVPEHQRFGVPERVDPCRSTLPGRHDRVRGGWLWVPKLNKGEFFTKEKIRPPTRAPPTPTPTATPPP